MAEWKGKMAITGYRKGKAPEHLLIEQMGGIQRVYNTVMAELMESVLAPTLETTPSGARAIADSERVEQSGEELENAFDPEKDFTFSVLFDTMPELQWTTPYKDLAVTVEAATNDEQIAATVEAKMRALMKEGGKMRVVTGRGIQPGDVAIIDFSAALADSGEIIPGASRQGMQVDTETVDVTFMPGVAGAMLGMSAGETRETVIALPETEEVQQGLRGVQAAITVKVSEVFEWELPAADDAWAAGLMGPGSTVDDLRARLDENTRAEGMDLTNQRVADAFTDAVAAAVAATVPESLLQEAGQNQYSNELNTLIKQGIMTFEQAQQLATPAMLSKYIANKKEELTNLQKSALGFADILEKEALAPTEAAIEQELAAALESLEQAGGNKGGDINVDGVKEQVMKNLQTQSAMDWLVKNCNVTITTPGSTTAAAPKAVAAVAGGEGEAPKKKRGRPRKNPEA